MTVMIRRAAVMPQSGPGGVAIAALTDKRVYIDRSKGGSATKEVVRTGKIINTGAGDVTLTAADDGAVVIFDNATSRKVNLPATAKNLKFTFIVKTPTAGGGHSVSPVTADKIMGNGFTSADNKDAICTGASDREGDCLTIEGDGLDGWFITSVTGTWDRE